MEFSYIIERPVPTIVITINTSLIYTFKLTKQEALALQRELSDAIMQIGEV